MPIEYQCFSCGAPLLASDAEAGSETVCPHCGAPVRAPERSIAPETVQAVPVELDPSPSFRGAGYWARGRRIYVEAPPLACRAGCLLLILIALFVCMGFAGLLGDLLR